MITTVGKVLAFVLVVLAFIGLGLSLWLYLDRRDWKKEVDAVNLEIKQRQDSQARAEGILQLLAKEINEGNRQMPWSIEVGGDGALAPQSLPVNKAVLEIKEMEAANKTLQEQVQDLQVQLLQLISQLRDARTRTETSLAEQLRLREEIEAHKFGNQVRPFRDVIAEARKEKEAAEAQQEALRPGLVNALAELAIALKRAEQLNRRLEELKGGAQ